MFTADQSPHARTHAHMHSNTSKYLTSYRSHLSQLSVLPFPHMKRALAKLADSITLGNVVTGEVEEVHPAILKWWQYAADDASMWVSADKCTEICMWLRTASGLPDGHVVFEQRLESTRQKVRQVLSADAVSGSIASACMQVMSSFTGSLHDPGR